MREQIGRIKLTRRELFRASGIIALTTACKSLSAEPTPQPEPTPELPGIADLDFPLSGDMHLLLGPHFKGREEGVRYAIDVFSSDKNARVVSAKYGTVVIAEDYMVEVDIGDGYALEYVHVGKIQVKIGEKVHRGMNLGEMTFNSPKGGSSDPDHLHLHFGIKRYGKPIDIDGKSIAGWIIRKGENPGDGTMSKEDEYVIDNQIVVASLTLGRENLLPHPKFAKPGAAR